MEQVKFNNGDLSFDLDKIKSFDAPITVAKSFDDNLDYPFGIDVEDSSYWYATETERNQDYEILRNTLLEFTFID